MKKLRTIVAVLLLLLSLCGCSGDKVKGEELYQRFWDCGLFQYDEDGEMQLNRVAAKIYIDGIGYDWDLNDCVDDINAYLKSIGEDPIS